METTDKYLDYEKKDVIGKVPEHLWYGWLERASAEDKADEDFMKKLVVRRGECLRFAPDSLKSDRDIVLKAAKSDPSAFTSASEELQNDRRLVKQAVNLNSGVIRYVKERFRNDKGIALLAVRKDGGNLSFLSKEMQSDVDVIRAVLDAFPGAFENLPEDVQENLDFILFGLESVVRHLPDPDNYSFFADSTSEYYEDFDRAETDFLDLFESIPSEALRDDPSLNDWVCQLAVGLNGAYYKEGNFPYEDVHDEFLRRVEALYEENDIPVRPVLKEALAALRREREEKSEARYGGLDSEERLFAETLDRYERIVGRSVMKYKAEEEREYLRSGGAFVQNCMLSFVKALVYAQRGLYHDSARWDDDAYEVDLDKAFDEISARLSPHIRVVREVYEFYYSENVTVDVTDSIHLILVRAAPLRIMEIWVNQVDSEHEHGKWLAPDRLGAFCDMVGHISDIFGKYEQLAERRATELRDRFGL